MSRNTRRIFQKCPFQTPVRTHKPCAPRLSADWDGNTSRIAGSDTACMPKLGPENYCILRREFGTHQRKNIPAGKLHTDPSLFGQHFGNSGSIHWCTRNKTRFSRDVRTRPDSCIAAANRRRLRPTRQWDMSLQPPLCTNYFQDKARSRNWHH